MKKALPTLASRDAARLLLGAQGLLEDPTRQATPAALRRLLERLGFVQLDSINTVARAHDLILRACALADWRERLRRLPPPPQGLRLLAPFDPVVRDRARALRRFGFDYRFEAFTPPAKRQYGYYVLPLLEGERLVGRLDSKLHREQRLLEVKGLWWEPGTHPTRARLQALEQALWRLAALVGAEDLRGL